MYSKKFFISNRITRIKWYEWTYSGSEGYLFVNVFDWFVNIVSVVCVSINTNNLYYSRCFVFVTNSVRKKNERERKNKRRRAERPFFICLWSMRLWIDFFFSFCYVLMVPSVATHGRWPSGSCSYICFFLFFFSRFLFSFYSSIILIMDGRRT
jgi:hypothetical protein